MAARFKEAFGVDTRLIGGGGGIFDVKVDGRLVYSKHDPQSCGNFPDEAALVDKIRSGT